MIPKQSVKFAVAAYLEGAVSAFYVTSTLMDQTLVDVVKVLPLAADNELVLATLWIDRTTAVLRHVEGTHARQEPTRSTLSTPTPRLISRCKRSSHSRSAVCSCH